MPGLVGNPPAIFTPGIGPNGPGPIDARRPITSVGAGSSVPYGPTDGYAASNNGVTGFVGPAAASLHSPIAWYVRAAGSNNNGGSSTGASPDRSGTDGVTNGTTTFTSATAAFTSADVGKGICINTGSNARHHRIASVTNATTIILDRASSNASGLAWAIGGAWADIRAAVGDSAVNADSNSPVRPGDSVYMGAATQRIQSVFGSSWRPAFNGFVSIIADVSGQFTGDAGMVQLTAYTTNDKTATPFNPTIDLNGNGNFLFTNLFFVVGNTSSNNGMNAAVAGSANVFWRNCAFQMGASAARRIFNILVPYNTNMNWLFDRCRFIGGGTGLVAGGHLAITATLGAAADYDMNITMENCHHLLGPTPVIALTTTGSGSGKAGGLRIYNASCLGPAFLNVAANFSVTIPCVVRNSFFYPGDSAALTAATLGEILEDYNFNSSQVANSNVTAGVHSQNAAGSSWAPLFHFGQELIWGGLPRLFGEPMAASPMLGFGNDGEQTMYDLYNGPRPAGGGSGFPFPAVGALERGSTASQATSPAPPSGTHSWQNTGPWYQDFLLPVSNTQTTVSISVQRDSAYAPPPGATLPAMLILANGGLGIPAQTIVDVGASGQWNTLAAAAFTPSGAGWVTIRIASYDGSGVSVVSFADVSIS